MAASKRATSPTRSPARPTATGAGLPKGNETTYYHSGKQMV
jgi:hypothetical protein